MQADSMIIKVIFMSLMAILAWVDYKKMIVPNWIVLPAIVAGVALTHQWVWALVLFVIGVFGYSCERDIQKFGLRLWGGGDVKLFAMMGAFIGALSIPIVLFGYLGVQLYRITARVFYRGLPMTPFLLASSLIFIWF